jgi:hypothetical protein
VLGARAVNLIFAAAGQLRLFRNRITIINLRKIRLFYKVDTLKVHYN